jgi:hypothetical protein
MPIARRDALDGYREETSIATDSSDNLDVINDNNNTNNNTEVKHDDKSP